MFWSGCYHFLIFVARVFKVFNTALAKYHVLLVLFACSASCYAFNFLRKVATKTHAGTVTL
ncbi:hypothetical protein JT114_03575 [Helicobacter pylori]|nr:hypothetical protein [Helicobacter pylori]WRB09794.1 hypothetical protein KVM63_07730 [Helicobacter pylori]